MKVLILGAGVIGVTTAYYLAKAGHDVTVIERRAAPALEPSIRECWGDFPRSKDDDPATDPFMQTIISEVTQDNSYYNDYWESLNVTTLIRRSRSHGRLAD